MGVFRPGCDMMTGFGVTAFVLIAAIAALLVWLFLERRRLHQLRTTRLLYTLSEEVLSARSPSEILEKLQSSLGCAPWVHALRLYLVNRKAKALMPVPLSGLPPATLTPLDSRSGQALCFRNRTLIAVRDARRESAGIGAVSEEQARAAIYIPLLDQAAALGVLEIAHRRTVRRFNRDHLAAAQHLGNQIAISLKLQERHRLREQHFQTEKLAVSGQLLSGIAKELNSPLEAIEQRASRLLGLSESAPLREDIDRIISEARAAAGIVARLVGYTRPEQQAAGPVNLHDVLASLMQFREREWASRRVEVECRLAPVPLIVHGDRSQLEQVFLNLLVLAEKQLLESETRRLSVSTRLLAQRALIEITHSGISPSESPDAVSGSAVNLGAVPPGLDVCRGILRGHGGDLRVTQDTGQGCRYEVELPCSKAQEPTRPGAPRSEDEPHRQLTVLIVEPERETRRELLDLVARQGHRAVPVTNAEQAADLATRYRFDAVFCAARLPGGNWPALSQRVREHTRAFVLLSEGYGENGSTGKRGEEMILSKPIEEAAVCSVLRRIQQAAAGPETAPAA